MKRLVSALGVSLFLVACVIAPLPGQENGREFYVKKSTEAPVINGVLDDKAWEESFIETGEWTVHYPSFGGKLEQKTLVYATYDDTALYFAFRCLDTDPSQIKTSVSQRDEIANDDWICVMIDSLGMRQIAYEHFSNANGIQYDVLGTPSGWDKSIDWVWELAANLTSDGYHVEMRIPLNSIRYEGGKEARMGLSFRRRVNSSGKYANWPDLPPNRNIFTEMATFVYRDLPSPRTMEILPSVTFFQNQDREAPARWSSPERQSDFGIGVKYGLTSSITLDATFNPDFSQVESDAFQVEVNQRYPIFYTENRPFFMEGIGLFEMPMSGADLSMTKHIHTRRIVDPRWGVKITGTVGKLSFGTISATDEAAGRIIAGGADSLFSGKNKLFNIGRVMYDLGGDSYVGGIVTDTEFADMGNRVFGVDGVYRIGDHLISGFAVQTSKHNPSGEFSKEGFGGAINYGFRSVIGNIMPSIWIVLEHYDEGFQWDTAIYKRTGITIGHVAAGFLADINDEKCPWLERIWFATYYRQGEDRLEQGTDKYFRQRFQIYFPRSWIFTVNYIRSQEPWSGCEFDTDMLQLSVNGRFGKWLTFNSSAAWSDAIYYDAPVPFAGKLKDQVISVLIQPTQRFRYSMAYRHVDFDRTSNGGNVYTVHILNLKGIYQFNEQLATRAIVQYNSYRKRVMTDFLASYELIPGTVVYAGYGSLIERRQWDEDRHRWQPGLGDYLTTRRSLFFKASYLWRF